MSIAARRLSSRLRLSCCASVLCASGRTSDAAQEDAVRAVLDHALEELARDAAGRGMIDEGGGGRLLLAAQQIGAVEAAFAVLAVEAHLDVMARQTRAEGRG